MRQVIVVWNQSGEVEFERGVPLRFNAERNRRLGARTEFDVLFLEGLNLLSPQYRERLSGLGYRLHDVESLYRQIGERYAVLARFGDYERKCFLRWLVIRKFYGNSAFVHYDADVVFNADPAQIEREFAGLTFILQGCPAYTRVEDTAWLDGYATELERFVSNIEAYSADAWRERDVLAQRARALNGGLWDRRILSSDQDLLQFLTLAGRLPQADSAVVDARCTTALFQNPLVIGRDIRLPLPLEYSRRDGIDYIADRKVAFWHMQGDFCDYLGYAAFRKSLGYTRRVPWVRGSRAPGYFAYRAVKKITPAYSRGELVQRYFGTGEDLGFVLNGDTFWQEGVFS